MLLHHSAVGATPSRRQSTDQYTHFVGRDSVEYDSIPRLWQHSTLITIDQGGPRSSNRSCSSSALCASQLCCHAVCQTTVQSSPRAPSQTAAQAVALAASRAARTAAVQISYLTVAAAVASAAQLIACTGSPLATSRTSALTLSKS
jgi:hypothetical protein